MSIRRLAQQNASVGNTAVLDQITLGLGGTRDYPFGFAGHLEQVTAGANDVLFTSDDEGRLADLSRPVAQLELDGSGGETLLYLITDHLGTPVVALDETGADVWNSAFEPFGRDAEEATPDGALANVLFLRFPGQWEDGRWAGATMGAETIYNLHRWYQPGTARYSRVDPVRRTAYAYVNNNPPRFIDPLGLRQWPFGAGKFCRDKSCRCQPPIKVLGEDSATFIASPGLGGCVDADAVYSVQCVLKIPDNMTCTLQCDSGGRGELVCDNDIPILSAVAEVLLDKKPVCFTEVRQIPRGWPPNPFWSGGSL